MIQLPPATATLLPAVPVRAAVVREDSPERERGGAERGRTGTPDEGDTPEQTPVPPVTPTDGDPPEQSPAPPTVTPTPTVDGYPALPATPTAAATSAGLPTLAAPTPTP